VGANCAKTPGSVARVLRKTQVLVTSCETGAGAWRHQEQAVRAHFPIDDPRFALTENPDEADVILIGNLREENDYAKLRSNLFLRAFPQKCVVLYDGDHVPWLCQGILTSLTHSRFNFGRFRSGGYFLFHPDFKNGFVERWYASRKDRLTPPPPKAYLACFSGRACVPVRQRLFDLKWQRDDVFIRDTSHSFDNFTHHPLGKDSARESYFNVALRSKFMLCPRGDGAASIRFFEAMQLGVAPVLISDDWVLPEGPVWSRCMLRVREDELDTLEEILVRNEERAATIGAEAQRAYEAFFEGSAYVRYLIESARAIQRDRTWIPERCFHWAWRPARSAQRLAGRVRRKLGGYAHAIRTTFRRNFVPPAEEEGSMQEKT
jgi:hypothetical protein